MTVSLLARLPNVLILPGLGNSGPDHWQSHWERQDSSCVRLMQDEWDRPDCFAWTARLEEAVLAASTPLVLAAHSSACALVAHWVARAEPRHLAKVRGALLVAPSDPDGANFPEGPTGFGRVPLARLPFPTIVVGSTNDPYISAEGARGYADAWGSRFVLLENAGHINVAAGFGPWPDGLQLLYSLRAPA